MNKTTIMTLRVPVTVRRALERLSAQLGYKPAHLGARLVEEGLRRRSFPQIDLRETAGGRVAYVKGTRLTVSFVVEQVSSGRSAEKVGRDFDISRAQVNAALAYAEAFPAEIELDIEEAAENRHWLELQESAWRRGHSIPKEQAKSKIRQ
jgi:uncharacterized protein (DUF433 family)